MKRLKTSNSAISACIGALTLFLVMSFCGTALAAGLLKPKNGESSAISIKSHKVTVVIDNGFARTEVDQVFTNTGDRDLEAVYSFPLPREASLSEVSLWIDNREIVGEVLEKSQAKTVFDDQKKKGKSTALAEKDDYKTFNVSVYPVRAGGDTRIRLVYYQPLHIDLNVGRYVYPLQEGGVDEQRMAFWSVDSAVREAFSFDLILKSAQPIKDVRMPGYSQQAQIERQTKTENGEQGGNSTIYHARLDLAKGATLSKDIVFYYRLDDTVPARVELVPYKQAGAPAGTFMLTITPGASLAKITEGTDWVFVLDKSGSMSGDKIETLKKGVEKVLGKMQPSDRFRIVTFNSEAKDLTGGFVAATPDTVRKTTEIINGITASKGTALYEGLRLGLRKLDEERTTAIILVTDGVANIGPTRHDQFLDLVNQQDVRLFTFIIGNSANRPLLDSLAKASGGFAMDVSCGDDIYGRILQAKNKVLYEAFHDVKVAFSGGGISDLTPTSPGTLYRGQQLVLFGKYTTPGRVSITLNAKISGKQEQWTTQAVLPDQDESNPEIERLFGLSAIDDLMATIRVHGESDNLRNRIVALGKQYSLVTDYTSMVVLDDQEAESLGIQRDNQKRVATERAAQAVRASAQVKNYRTDTASSNSMFKGASAPGIGSGPVGPFMIALLLGCGGLLRRRN